MYKRLKFTAQYVRSLLPMKSCNQLCRLSLLSLLILSTIGESAVKVSADLRGMKRSCSGKVVAHFLDVSLQFRTSILEPGDDLCI